MNARLLDVQHLTVALDNGKALLNDISFYLKHNQCLGIVGESGSGKSLTCKAIMGLLEPNFKASGKILFNDIREQSNHNVTQDLLSLTDNTIRQIRGKQIAMILQHPMNAFDPLYRIGTQVIETLQAHQSINKQLATEHTLAMMDEMGLDHPKTLFNKYPHQLSGGMLQRIMIGIALMLKPALIIADEPTTALDSITQFHILSAFEKIKQQSSTALIFISHDLGVIHHIADHIVVMQYGKIVEQGNKNAIFNSPQCAYTRYLIETRQQILDKFNATLNFTSGHEKP